MLPNDEKQQILTLLRYFESHFREELHLSVLANLVGFHPAYLSRLFKKETGYTITEYLGELRLHLATQALTSNRKTILEIATESGYNNISYFNRVFKESQGMSPGVYRNYFAGKK